MINTNIQTAVEMLLSKKIGLEPRVIGSKNIARAVESRTLACGLADEIAYWEFLQLSHTELSELIDSVIVPETWFFRQRESFTFLKHYLKQRQGRGPHSYASTGETLRILSVPCSSGEEPYSIAITLLEAGLEPSSFCIDAVDISQRVLNKARQGIYKSGAFRRGSSILKKRYFHSIHSERSRTSQGSYQLRREVRDQVKFHQGNILAPLFLARQEPYEIIFCRNLLIYLGQQARQKVMRVLQRLLKEQGLLFVGAAETGQMSSNHFVSVNYPLSFAYQKGNQREGAFPFLRTAPETNYSANTHTPNSTSTSLSVNASAYTSTGKGPFPPNRSASAPTPPPIKRNKGETGPQNAKAASSTSTRSQGKGNSLLDMARKLADQGDLQKATHHCHNYLAQHPTSTQAYVLLGEVHRARDEDEKAEQFFQKALYLEPNSYPALIHLALIKEQNGDYQRAKIIRQRIYRLVNSHQST